MVRIHPLPPRWRHPNQAGILSQCFFDWDYFGIIIPTLNFEKCRQCKLCTQICLNKAVYIANKEIEIDKEKCQGCGHCVSMCPENALTL